MSGRRRSSMVQTLFRQKPNRVKPGKQSGLKETCGRGSFCGPKTKTVDNESAPLDARACGGAHLASHARSNRQSLRLGAFPLRALARPFPVVGRATHGFSRTSPALCIPSDPSLAAWGPSGSRAERRVMRAVPSRTDQRMLASWGCGSACGRLEVMSGLRAAPSNPSS